MKFSLIMPSFLGEYENCANKRDKRFIFAVNSYLKQSYDNSELIIISDGCDKTEEIYNSNFKKYRNIKFEKIIKTTIFSGETRNIGIEISQGDYVLFLDTDDFIGNNHLKIISENINEFNDDWIYYDDYVYKARNFFEKRTTIIKEGVKILAGSSSICYKKSMPVKWKDGYGHDHWLIQDLIKKSKNYRKIKNHPEYFICHIPVPGPLFDIDNPSYCYSGKKENKNEIKSKKK